MYIINAMASFVRHVHGTAVCTITRSNVERPCVKKLPRWNVNETSPTAQKPKTVWFVFAHHSLSMMKTTRLKSGWGFGQTNSPLSTARVLIDAVGLCLLRVNEVWRLFAPDLRRWINSFSGSDFKPRLVYKTWYFCYFFTNFDQQF